MVPAVPSARAEGRYQHQAHQEHVKTAASSRPYVPTALYRPCWPCDCGQHISPSTTARDKGQGAGQVTTAHLCQAAGTQGPGTRCAAGAGAL